MAGQTKGEKLSKAPQSNGSRPGAGGFAALVAGIVAIVTVVAIVSPNTFWRGNRAVGPQGVHQSTSAASVIEHIGIREFDERVLHSKEPVLVDFYADWCGPCQMLAPVLEQVARETPHAKIVKVNVDQNGELARRYQIEAIPSLLVFRDGNLINRHTGLADAASVKQLLQ
jgi:thioredoxin 1